MEYFVDVILPIPIQSVFTYRINSDEARFLQPGMRVLVSFGKSKIYTALVDRIHQQKPGVYEAKDIEQILDEEPIVNERHLQFWKWIADYYMCTLGEVMRAALSRQFLLESETLVMLNTEASWEESQLSDEELLVVEALQLQAFLRIEDIQKMLDKYRVLPLIHSLVAKNIVYSKEEAREVYKPKLTPFLRIHARYRSGENLKDLLETLQRSPRQKEAVMAFFSMQSQTPKSIKTRDFQKQYGLSSAVIKALIEKEIFEEYTIREDRISFKNVVEATTKKLSRHQQQAREQIENEFLQKDVVLLHGVTSGGKTEVYSQLIEKTLEEGKQVLYMLPEIALTTQLIDRLSTVFGDKMSVYHSRFSIQERIETWYQVLENKHKGQLVIGARSAVFLPFQKLGLIIVDEEHEPSYKQFSPAPRYHARDAAIVLAKLFGAQVLLGSATPAIETYYNAQIGKYGFAQLTERYGQVQLPVIQFVNLKESHFKKKMQGNFSQELVSALSAAFLAGNQAILFQNRRGYSPTIACRTCGHSPSCPHCDVTLTYHQFNQQLRCHYCGYHMAMQQSCMACGSHLLDTVGLGTEQIEEEVKKLFPEIQPGRMDQDTTRSKNAYSQLITRFEEGEIDVLIGTQMVAKGLDFRKVTVVGVIQADQLLNFPDFRAHERCFQLLMQVAGRAGRTDVQGQVLIQSYYPEHPVLQQVAHYDYEGMYQKQLSERQKFHYPPFYRLIKLTVKDRKLIKMTQAAQWLAETLKQVFGSHVLGPEQPPVGRIRNEYLTHILIKIPQQHSLTVSKKNIRKAEKAFKAIKDYRSVKLVIDVDCQ